MRATAYVLEYHLVSYRRVWRGSALSSFLLPLLTVLGFGLGVGAYVDGVDGVPYLDWLVPGLIASTAMQVGIGEATWPVLGGFEWRRTYFGHAAAPLRISDILDGHLAFVVFRVLTTVSAFLLVAAAFGALHSWWSLAVLPIVALVGLAVAAPTFAYSATIRSEGYLSILMRLGMLPMSLFSGVFFPIDQMPDVLVGLAYALPLWHGVELARLATLGLAPQLPVAAHLLVLAAWIGGGWVLARHRFRRRLVV
ncbi:ABC transporter permease [Actinoplanes sp. NBRC 103695]|uniref:ABC transporter permease n=1 Tax=Actinoplanes sp. NBRC 103695 TaxID=3032202 RepID=UPI0024A5BE7C|nr:ABC transporter permease [Actinoplanes sp. NBRC 103695]GLZ01317.1 transport permease protein [Actinoplanes sp. NBRC 103695]